MLWCASVWLDNARAMPNSPAQPGAQQPPIHVTSPTAMIASLPYLVGFIPHDSVVLLFLAEHSNQVVVSLRVDLPPVDDAAVEDDVVAMITETVRGSLALEVDLHMAHLVLWHDDANASAHRRLVTSLTRSLQDLGIRTGHCLATDGLAMWDYGPGHSECCTTSGHTLDGEEVERIRFALVVSELGFVPSRSVLASSLTPAITLLSEAGFTDARAMLTTAEFEGFGDDWRREVEDDLVAACQRRCDPTELATVGAIWAVALSDARVREPLMYRLLQVSPPQERRRGLSNCRAWLTALTTMTPEPYQPAVAATLAAVTWQLGDGAFATIAAEKALSTQPNNSLARIVQASAKSGVPPQKWHAILDSIGLAQLRGTQQADQDSARVDPRDPLAWPTAS